MPEDRPTPPPDLLFQSRDQSSPPYERAAAQAELDSWYRTVAYPEPAAAGAPPPPPPGAPAAAGMLAPRGGVPASPAAPYVPPDVGGQPIAPELRQGLAAAAAGLGLPEVEVPGLMSEYRKLVAASEPPPPERVAEQLRGWHGEARGTQILAAARAAVAEAIRRDPSLGDVAGVLGCSAYAITVLGLAELRARE